MNVSTCIPANRQYVRSHFRGLVVFLALTLVLGGCTILQNVKKKPTDDELARSVMQNKALLDRVKDDALSVAPSEYSQAVALVGEMEHYLSESESDDAWRVEKKVQPLIKKIQSNIKKHPSSTWESDPKQYRAKMALLISEVEGLKTANRLQARRLESTEAARNDAIKEVVRIRSRMQGMASPTEAAAMFAEARVIIDRMTEDAYNIEAKEYLSLARKFMKDGMAELDGNNPGGAAYLFDLVSATYEDFRGIDSRTLSISVRSAVLRAGPSKSSARKGLLSYGVFVEGLSKKGPWFSVRTSEGLEGWLHESVVR